MSAKELSRSSLKSAFAFCSRVPTCGRGGNVGCEIWGHVRLRLLQPRAHLGEQLSVARPLGAQVAQALELAVLDLEMGGKREMSVAVEVWWW